MRTSVAKLLVPVVRCPPPLSNQLHERPRVLRAFGTVLDLAVNSAALGLARVILGCVVLGFTVDSAVLGLARVILVGVVLGFTMGCPLSRNVIGITMLLRLKPGHTCDAINVVAEFMVDVTAVETRPCV
jgi:hypothetical protein